MEFHQRFQRASNPLFLPFGVLQPAFKSFEPLSATPSMIRRRPPFGLARYASESLSIGHGASFPGGSHLF
jgi:hypothetical protein